jgi:hypothetical protein
VTVSPGDHLASKARALHPAKERQAPRVALVGKDDHRATLRDGLQQQDTRRRRAPRKVAREEPLVAAQCPLTARPHPGLQGEQRVEKQKRVAGAATSRWDEREVTHGSANSAMRRSASTVTRRNVRWSPRFNTSRARAGAGVPSEVVGA